MEESVRLQYLEAMGIDVWVPRHPPVVAEQAVAAPVGLASQSEADHFDAPDNEAAPTPEHPATSETAVNPQHAEPAAQTVESAAPRKSESDAFAPLPHHPKSHTDDQAWKELQHQVAICRACSLCETRTQTVFGVGNKHADWLLIGEAPGRDEDLQGEPFVGRAGQLLNEMIRAIGLRREQVYIANMLKCRPPNNRDPQAGEVDACHGFLQRQIELIRPKLIVAVGRIAAQNLLKTQQPLSRLRGIRHELEGVPLTVVHHPAYLLRSLPEKAKAWEDLQFALSVYQSLQL
ncbi:uracil-DNA glycosylase [Methylomonas koyamae]|uniref:Type-4 uracil-DNA glycosylase n=1 Tax=Methylomonas koyamae TaxID=702114 RepID=A0A291IGA4_9GAMM|nr:uracil-DNA glycosylase [Methylomonas koyamae]ATG89405.1 DNA polymerase [Methylomonas koyamae]OAI29878.1 uracil-DNA glycosylase [Methylomonas koyamae]